VFERFTRPARESVTRATAIAREASAAEVRPDHLFGALLEQDTGPAAQALEGLGAPVADVRAELERRRSQYVDGLDADDADALRAFGIDLDEVVRRIDRNLGGTAPRRGQPRFSRSSKKVLELALREAIALRHNYIGTEHLLLATVREGDRVVADTLAEFGVDRVALRRQVADVVRRAG
jgi:ATP-dependent Clp protease ATP-binding subunit ClpA